MEIADRWRHSTRATSNRRQALWDEFLALFIQTLDGMPDDVFAWAWGSGTKKGSAANRTSFYRNGVLPRVAHGMGLIDTYELFRVDSTFCVGESREKRESLVPIVHVESENKAADAGHEVRKLCSLTSRLKVLISCDEWSGAWRRGGHSTKYLAQWRALVRNHLLYHPDDCEIGVIVAERRDVGTPAETVDFYATTLTEPYLTGPGKVIVTRAVAGVVPCIPVFRLSRSPLATSRAPGSSDLRVRPQTSARAKRN